MIHRLSIVAALVLAAATSAHAQNNKPVRSGTYYEDRVAIGSSGASSILLNFAITPSDKYLNVTRVMCGITTNVSQLVVSGFVYIGTTSGGAQAGRTFFLEVPPLSTVISNTRYYSFVNQPYFKVGPGRYPTIEFNAPSENSTFRGTANCTIVGDLSDD